MTETLEYEAQSELVRALWASDQAGSLTNQAARRIEELESQLRTSIDVDTANSGHEPSLIRYLDRYAKSIALTNDERCLNFIVKNRFLDTVFGIMGAARHAGYMLVDFADMPKSKRLEQMQHIVDAVIDYEFRGLFSAEDLLNEFELICDRNFPEPLRRSASSTPSETLDRYLRTFEPSSSLIRRG